MKKILFLIIAFCSLKSFAQSDSIQSKLQHYKKMYNDSLISNEDYDKLKQQLLFGQDVQKQSAKPIITKVNIDSLRKNYLYEIIPGSIMIGLGMGGIAGGVYYTRHNFDGKTALNITESELKDFKIKRIIIFTSSAVFIGVGTALDILGVLDKKKYIDKKNSVSISMASENIGVRFTF